MTRRRRLGMLRATVLPRRNRCVVKFRCSFCTQKISVNDEGKGAVIACPTCDQSLIVPGETSLEFQGKVVLYPGRGQEPVNQPLRAALVPELARLMMNRLVAGIMSQRRHLLETQATGTAQIVELEQRMLRLHEQHQARMQEFEQRAASRDAENNRLRRENAFLTRKLAITGTAEPTTPPSEWRPGDKLARTMVAE